MNIARYLKPFLSPVLLFVLINAITCAAQQNSHHNSQGFRAKAGTLASLDLKVENNARYFLGETPSIRIAITNTGHSRQSVKDAEHQKFSLEVSGLFSNATQRLRKTATYDGSWDVPKEPQTLGGMNVWLSPTKRAPKFVKLAPGESTALELDLSKVFSTYLGVSKYKMTVRSEDGHQVVKEFEVYFDDEKTVPILAKLLEFEDSGARNWAVSNLAQFNRARFVTLLEALSESGNERMRDFAREMLAETRGGWFDPVKLRVEIKDRNALGEAQMVAVSLLNNSSGFETVKRAEYQKFSLVVREVLSDGTKQEKGTCRYDGSQNVPTRSTGSRTKARDSIKLGESDSTTLSLNLSQCMPVQLGVGKYELVVKPVEPEKNFRDQIAVKNFEVY